MSLSIFDTLVYLASKSRGPSRELIMRATSATLEDDDTLTLRLPESALPLASPFTMASLAKLCDRRVLVESERAAFLRWLTQHARTYGWEGDYVEIKSFVEYCHHDADMPVPDLEPYPVLD